MAQYSIQYAEIQWCPPTLASWSKSVYKRNDLLIHKTEL